MPPIRKPATSAKAQPKPAAVKKMPAVKPAARPAAQGAKGKAPVSKAAPLSPKFKAQLLAAMKAPAKAKAAPAAKASPSAVRAVGATAGGGMRAVQEMMHKLARQIVSLRAQVKQLESQANRPPAALPTPATQAEATPVTVAALPAALPTMLAPTVAAALPVALLTPSAPAVAAALPAPPAPALPPGMGAREQFSVDRLRPAPQKIDPGMDPQLQFAVARAHAGMPRASLVAAAPGDIPVVAQVRDVQAWEALSEVQPGVTLGAVEDGSVIVTARVPILRVEAVRQQPFVVSLKASRPLRPVLGATTQEIGCRPELLPPGTAPDGGRGVVVGIVDFGGDFAHDNFRRADGSSRVEILWSQGAPTRPDAAVKYGRVFRRAEIDAALGQPDPYQALGYGTAMPAGTHGTHVMDIAAGNGRGSGVAGCAPEADLIFVDLLANDIPYATSDAVGTSLGDSVRFLEALRFVFDQAGTRPCVVNVSLGTNGGPHDGRTLVEQGMDTLVRDAPNRAIVVAAANSYMDGIHAAGSVPAGGSFDLLWDIPAGTGVEGGAELELWMPGTRRLALELIAPDGSALSVVEPGSNSSIKDQGQVVIYLANRLDDPVTGDNTIGLFVSSVFPDGRWTVRLHDRSGDGQPAPFHAWIERYDTAQSSFPEPRDNTHTLGSVSCGRETIVVGSYDAHKPSLPLSYFSSAGPTRDGRQKPEISAPGHAVVAAQSRSRTGTITMSGTSMAAPAVCGIIALLFAEARRRGISLPIARTRQLLIENARRDPPPGTGWDPRQGYGRVSAAVLSGLGSGI